MALCNYQNEITPTKFSENPHFITFAFSFEYDSLAIKFYSIIYLKRKPLLSVLT